MSEIKLDHEELKSHIEDNMRAGNSLYVWGTTGIGKSQTVEEISRKKADELGKEFVMWNKLSRKEKHSLLDSLDKYYIFIDIRLSQMDPSDLRGLPDLNGKESVEWKVPFWVYVISQKDANGVLFFDELNLAPPSIQASAYQIINDKAIGEVAISPDVFIIGAGNRIEDKANVYDLPKPLQNRFCHCQLKVPHIDDWTEWAMEKDVDSRIITFLKYRPPLLFDFDTKSKEKAFPTPRSWGEFANKLIKGLPDDTNEQLRRIRTLVSSSVGSKAAQEFTSFIKLKKKINLQDILKNPEKASEIKEMDMKYSLISLISEWYDKNYKKKDLETLLEISTHIQKEFAILLLRMAKNKHRTSFINNINKIDIWKKEVGVEYGKYII
jgi:hypothetical protein